MNFITVINTSIISLKLNFNADRKAQVFNSCRYGPQKNATTLTSFLLQLLSSLLFQRQYRGVDCIRCVLTRTYVIFFHHVKSIIFRHYGFKESSKDLSRFSNKSLFMIGLNWIILESSTRKTILSFPLDPEVHRQNVNTQPTDTATQTYINQRTCTHTQNTTFNT